LRPGLEVLITHRDGDIGSVVCAGDPHSRSTRPGVIRNRPHCAMTPRNPRENAVKYDEFITKVGGRADVSLEAADALTAATLQTLAERISGGEAADLAAQLPRELQGHLTGAEEPPSVSP
jgi:hypothetical protein